MIGCHFVVSASVWDCRAAGVTCPAGTGTVPRSAKRSITLGSLERGGERGRELLDGLGRGAGGRPHSVPDRHLEAGQARLVQSRQVEASAATRSLVVTA